MPEWGCNGHLYNHAIHHQSHPREEYRASKLPRVLVNWSVNSLAGDNYDDEENDNEEE